MKKRFFFISAISMFLATVTCSCISFSTKAVATKAADDTTYILVGNMGTGPEWNNNPDKSTYPDVFFTKYSEGDYRINNFYMKTHDWSDFRIVPINTWSQDYGYNQIKINTPVFTASAADNNIHISQNGYYDFRLYINGDTKRIDIAFHSDNALIECQIWKDNVKMEGSDRTFDFEFTYNNNQVKKVSQLGGDRRLTVDKWSKFYLNSYSMPSGVYLADYRLGYTDNCPQYFRPDPSYNSPAVPGYNADTDSGVINYINMYFFTATECTKKDIPVIVTANNEVSDFFKDAEVGILCYGGGIQPYTVKVDRLGSTMIGTAVIPWGTLYMDVIRTDAGSLPCAGLPSKVHNHWDKIKINTAKNVITITGWGASDCGYNTIDSTKVVLLANRPVMFDAGGNADWFNADAKSYVRLNAMSSDYYGYTSSESWHELTRINTSGYLYFVPSQTIIADMVIATRNNGQSGWDYVWGQTTDIVVEYGFNPLYITNILNTQSDVGSYNWKGDGAQATASWYGYYFMDKITCSGLGDVTFSSSAWTDVTDMYSKLTSHVQDTIFTTVGDQEGTNIEKAMARYDYIVFFKHYGYTDFISRGNAGSGKSISGYYFNYFEAITFDFQSSIFISLVVCGAICSALVILIIKKRVNRRK